MALFGKKKKEEKEVEVVKTTKKKVVKKTPARKFSQKKMRKIVNKGPQQKALGNKVIRDLSWVLKTPRITEKGAIIAETNNVYTFNVDKKATKIDIKQAIELLYKVVPVKVAITRVPSKKVQVRGQRGKLGTKSGGKKAFVYLKKGDKIEFV